MTLDEALERLAEASAAAREIGLMHEAAQGEALLERARARTGFSGAAYVLALAGGTGVGKSSVLNALAGHPISAVRAVRPTTDEPIAWVAEARREELAPLLAWLGVRHVAAHADADLSSVAILDLPDVDSVRTQHRATVDALLPRIDAVAWVLDPEKYDDARLHAYLRAMAPHASRLRFILNKADRLSGTQSNEVAEDLRRRLSASGIDDPRIQVVSASTGHGIESLRAELASEADAKALIAAKLTTDATEAHHSIARAVGLEPDGVYRPLVDPARRADAVERSVEGAIALVDSRGLARQVQLAVLGRARRTGGSLLGRAVALLGWMTGQSRRSADPAAYLRAWRNRGSLGRAVNPVHGLLVEAAAGVPSSSRAVVATALRADTLEGDLARAIDLATRAAGEDLRIPGSLLWPVVGAIQLVVGAVFAFAVAWYVTLFISQGSVPVAIVDAPLLGPLPLPLVLLVASIAISAVLGLLLSLHAGWIGRRVGSRVAARARAAVESSVADAGLGHLDRVERARRAISTMT